MQVQPTAIREVFMIQPRQFNDERGWFRETFNLAGFEDIFKQQGQVLPQFVQDNHSLSHQGVLRGLHYQLNPHAQGKLIRVVQGKSYNVAVDLRQQSKTFAQWITVELDNISAALLWIPPGFAHGFVALDHNTQLLYKTTAYYAPASERTLQWNDPDLAIQWPLDVAGQPIISSKDEQGLSLKQAIQQQALF
ncbi:MAG: dTDP-4-dehydrorhamnose 3,5-epimerase [Moraxellaceae bacterium]|nr:MAG: dTDP-4-dehydrorhamnose 3,5-epimerase [Moraxellaceae bacterium]